MANQKIQLGYWKIRGLAQPARLLMAYAKADFDDIHYEQGDGPEFSKEAWMSVKYTMGFGFPNLPYLIDGDIKITQSNAILRYLGSKFNLLGEDVKVRANSEMVLEEAMDLRNGLVRVIYNKDYASIVGDYFTQVDSKLEQFNTFLESKDWFAGGKNPTICDFHMYELLDQHRLMRPESVEKYPKLVAFLNRFEALPAIKAYMASDKFLKRPCNNKSGGWK